MVSRFRVNIPLMLSGDEQFFTKPENMITLKNVKFLNNPAAILTGIVLLAACLFLFRIGQEDMWNDEWFSYNLTNQPDIASFFDELVYTENTPPLYFLLLRCWSANGAHTAIVHLRLFSTLWAIAAVLMMFFAAREVFDTRTGLWGALLCAISPYVVWYAQEARNPSMEMCISVILFWSFVRYIKSGSIAALVVLGICNVIGLFTHYFFILLLPAQWIYLMMYGSRLQKWHGSAMLAGASLLFAVWIPSLWGQISMNRSGWLEPPTVFFPLELLAAFSNGIFYLNNQLIAGIGMMVCSALALFGLLDWSYKSKQRCVTLRYDSLRIAVILFFCTPLILAFCISWIKPIMFEGKRYLILILPYFLMCAAHGIRRIRSVKTAVIVVCVLSVCNGIFLYNLYAQRQKRPWKQATLLIEHYARPGDLFLSTDYTEGKLLLYYGLKTPQFVDIPDYRAYKKHLRGYNRLWFVSDTDGSEANILFGNRLPLISSRTFPNDQHQLITVMLFDLSNL